MPGLTLQQLNQLTEDEFTQRLGGIFEHSPWVAQGVYAQRPFDSVLSLHEQMIAIVNRASQPQRKQLICEHPELAGREAEQGQLTAESTSEQETAGLSHCSPQELALLRNLNQQYRQRFGFPFVIAVKGLSRHGILQALQQRLHNNEQQEFENCLTQIARIARFRLDDLISE